MKKISLALVLLTSLFARENPFDLKMAPKTTPQSVEEKEKRILESIKIELPSTARVLREVQFIYQKLDGSIETKKVMINSDIDWHHPITISQLSKEELRQNQKPRKYVLGDFEFLVREKVIHIHAPTPLRQNFVIPKPYRIILDFEQLQKKITEEKETNYPFFETLSLTTHKGFYRLTLELDGQYDYDIQRGDDHQNCYILTLY